MKDYKPAAPDERVGFNNKMIINMKQTQPPRLEDYQRAASDERDGFNYMIIKM